MKRSEIKNGELIAWAYGREDDSRPGFTLGPIPVSNRFSYGHEYVRARQDRGSNYLVLISSGQAERDLNATVDGGATAPGADFWGVGTAVLDYLKVSLAAMEENGKITSDGIPDGWSWEVVTASLLRGPYPPHRRVENARRAASQKVIDERDQARQANKARLEHVRGRLVAAELPSGFTDRVHFAS